MKLQIISVSTTSKQSKAGKPYQSAEVVYKNLESGKVENKNITQYSNVFKGVADAVQGQVFDVKNEKDDNGYWQWTSFVRDVNYVPGSAPAPTPAGTAVPAKGGTWETPEERAKKQVYIIKQSSISAAVAALSVGAKTPPSFEQIKLLAQQLTDFVLGTEKTDLFEQGNDLEVE